MARTGGEGCGVLLGLKSVKLVEREEVIKGEMT